jgi:hypothetical protein
MPGNTPHAKAFNCWQRSHQQTFETYPQFLACSGFAALCYPVATFAAVMVWFAGRITWANGYAASEGDPSKRYDSIFSKGIWVGFVTTFFLSLMTAINFLDLSPFW